MADLPLECGVRREAVYRQGRREGIGVAGACDGGLSAHSQVAIVAHAKHRCQEQGPLPLIPIS